jgi:hypothetical protein
MPSIPTRPSTPLVPLRGGPGLHTLCTRFCWHLPVFTLGVPLCPSPSHLHARRLLRLHCFHGSMPAPCRGCLGRCMAELKCGWGGRWGSRSPHLPPPPPNIPPTSQAVFINAQVTVSSPQVPAWIPCTKSVCLFILSSFSSSSLSLQQN